jgi:hypothetical protein
MSDDEVGPPEDEPRADRDHDHESPVPPPYDPDYELIGYLEEREGGVRTSKRAERSTQ